MGNEGIQGKLTRFWSGRGQDPDLAPVIGQVLGQVDAASDSADIDRVATILTDVAETAQAVVLQELTDVVYFGLARRLAAELGAVLAEAQKGVKELGKEKERLQKAIRAGVAKKKAAEENMNREMGKIHASRISETEYKRIRLNLKAKVTEAREDVQPLASELRAVQESLGLFERRAKTLPDLVDGLQRLEPPQLEFLPFAWSALGGDQERGEK